jgi:hypothetical protein
VDERGQASIELVAAAPALVLAALVSLQLLVTGYAWTLADGAAEAGAMALVADRPVEPAVRTALPGWADDRVDTGVDGGRVTVSVKPPALLESVAKALVVSSSAWVQPAAGR